MKRIVGFCTVFLACIVLSASFASASPVVQSGWLENDKGASVRFREFEGLNTGGGNDFEVGLYNDGGIQDQINWVYDNQWSNQNTFDFSYDGVGTATLNLSIGPDLNDWYTRSIAVTPQTSFNYMQIDVAARSAGVTVELHDLTLDGVNLGDFFANGDIGQFNSWYVTMFDFSNPFTVSGTLALSGLFPGSAELNRAQISFGYTEDASAVPVPAAVWLLGSGLVGLVGLRKKFRK